MAIEAGGRPPYNQDEHLTLSDAGAKSDLGTELEKIKSQQSDQDEEVVEVVEDNDQLASVTNLDDFRQQKAVDHDNDDYDEDDYIDTENADTTVKSSQRVAPSRAKPKHKITAKKLAAASALTLAGLQGANMVHEAVIARPEAVSVTSPQESFEIEDFPVGSELAVSSFSYTITGGNIRTSPKVVEGNLLDHTNFSGETIEHPIIIADQANPQNDDWLEFVDSKGKTLYTNLQNVEIVEDSSISSTESFIDVTITETGNHGITASDGKGNILTVATVVDNS